MIELDDEYSGSRLRIAAAGAGGAGCAAADSLTGWREDVRVIAFDTDARALKARGTPEKLQFGADSVRGFGAAENPETAKRAFLEDKDRIAGMLGRPDIVFIIAGLGGGAGTGAAPLLAETAGELGALSVAIATAPFQFEGKKRLKNAEEGLKALYGKADALVVIPNEELFSRVDPDSFLTEAFMQANAMILEVVKNVCEIMFNPGIFSVDLPRMRGLLGKSGLAFFGTGEAEGPGRWAEAVEAALSFPLMRGIPVSEAENVIVHISGGRDITQDEIKKISSKILRAGELNGVVGVTAEGKAGKKLRVRLFLTGIRKDPALIAGGAAGAGAEECALPPGLAEKFIGYQDELEVPAILRRKKKNGN